MFVNWDNVICQGEEEGMHYAAVKEVSTSVSMCIEA